MESTSCVIKTRKISEDEVIQEAKLTKREVSWAVIVSGVVHHSLIISLVFLILMDKEGNLVRVS